MKLTKIAAACGLAVAALSSQAFAHGPSVTPDLEVFISGSSALQNNLGKIAESMMPVTATTDVYYNISDNGSSYRAYFGTVSGTGTSLDGKKVLMHERAAGGSIYGVNPVAQATAITRMKIANDGTCVATGVAYPAATYKCSGTVNAVPDAGVSDVEPGMFVGQNLPSGWSALTAAELGHITPVSQNAVVFGIAVTDNVYAHVQSLSRAQITSLMTGAYQDWGMIDPSMAGHFVRVERRGAGSGTQASANAYFGGFPCSSGSVPLADATANNPGVYEVVENSSTGNVKSGLIADNTAGKYAIGLVSTENTPTAGWHFVSIDGVAASPANAIAGKYDYFVEQSMQWRNTTVNGVAAPVAGGAMDTFLNTFKARSGDPVILSTMPGVAALPTNYTPVLDINGVVTNDVMKGTKQNNTCSPTQMFY